MKKYGNLSPLFIVIAAMIVLNLVTGRFSDFGSWIMSTLYMLPGIVIGLSFHEFGHAVASNALGDPTPKAQGRLTINPAAHIDPFGFIALLLAGFGWGVPVQINPEYYKHRRVGELIVSLAGVFMNLIVAIAFAIVLKLLIASNVGFMNGVFGEAFAEVVHYVILINIILMIFNLLPVPPLDGFGIITQIFNLRKYNWYYQIYDKGFLILLVLILFDITDLILTPAVGAVYGWIFSMIIM